MRSALVSSSHQSMNSSWVTRSLISTGATADISSISKPSTDLSESRTLMAAYVDSMLNTLTRAWEIVLMVCCDKAPKVFLIKPCSIVNILPSFTIEGLGRPASVISA